MATIRQFNIGLYREHLEEASFLYEQRLAHLQDPEVDWPDLREVEDRLEAHIDALVVGGRLALEVCRLQASDSGEVHAALCVFCRQNLKDDAFMVLKGIDPTDDQVVDAVSSALRFEVPSDWRDDLIRLLHHGAQQITHVLARVAGFRRYPCEEALADKLAAKPQFGSADLAWALGRVGSRRSLPLLSSLLDSDDERISEAAALALLRLGDDRVLPRIVSAARTHPWARRVLAIGGDPRSIHVLLGALDASGPDQDTVLALGLLGDLAAIAPLVRLLDHESVSVSAAVALNTITGASLYSRTFVPEEFDPDELSDDERQSYETDGTLPTRDGQPLGNWQRGPVRDRTGWQTWLEENKHRFTRGYRWRMGQPYGPSALLLGLKCRETPHSIRLATSEELVVRYRLNVPFEVALPVHQQMRFLAKIETWVGAQPSGFDDGQWYLAGRLQT